MQTSSVTTKGQITIPRQIRKALNIQAGDKIGFLEHDGHYLIFRKEKDITSAFGLCKAKASVSLTNMEKVIKEKGSRACS